MSWRSFRYSQSGSPEARMWRIATTLVPVLILNSFPGNTFTLYLVAPVGWLLVGWISAEQLRNTAARSSSAESQNSSTSDINRNQLAA
jgi:hypothetical protein